jgi:transposase
MSMRAKPWEVPDHLWERIEPLLSKRPRRFRYPGRKPFDDRLALQGILFVLHTGVGWEHLPQELGFGCGMTAWRRLRAWQQAGVWERLHALLLGELHAADQLEWSRAVADSSYLQAKKGARKRPSPVDRGRASSKHHLLVDGGGVPLAWTLTAANRNDVTQLLDLLDRVTARPRTPGRPRRRPRALLADRGYDHDKYRRLLWSRGVKPIIARRQTEHGSGLGCDRWVIERTFAWLHNRRRLLLRTDRLDHIHEAFLALACCLICWRRLETSLS